MKSVNYQIRSTSHIVNYLLIVGDSIFEQDHIHLILNGLPEEYILFFMQMYGTIELSSLYNVEALLYVHEAKLDKFRQ